MHKDCITISEYIKDSLVLEIIPSAVPHEDKFSSCLPKTGSKLKLYMQSE